MQKTKSQLILKVLSLFFFSFNAYSQVNTGFTPGVTQSSYFITEGDDITDVLINFEGRNLETSAITGIVTMELTHSPEITYNDLSSTVAAGWSCSSGTPGTVCSTSGGMPASSSVFFTLAFNIGSTTPALTYFIDGLFIQNQSTEFDTDNNMISTGINVEAALIVDLQFSPLVTASSITIDSRDLTPQVIDYQVVNLGEDSFNGADVYFDYDFFSFTATVTSMPAGWSCNPVFTGSILCNTTDTFMNGDIANFQVDLVASGSNGPALAGDHPQAIIGEVLEGEGAPPMQNKGLFVTGPSLVATDVTINGDPDVVIDMQPVSGLLPGPKGGFVAIKDSIVTYKILANAINVPILEKQKNGFSGIKSDAAGVVITQTLPAAVTFSRFSEVFGPNFIGACSETSGVITCNVGDLPVTTAEDGIEIQVLVTGNIGDFGELTADVVAVNDVNPSNNNGRIGFFDIVGLVDLEMKKEAKTLSNITQTVFGLGENFQYVLTASNLSANDVESSDIRIEDTVPTGITIGSFTEPAGWDCSSSDLPNNYIRCRNTSAFLGNSSVEFIVPVVSSIAGQYSNSATIGAPFSFSSVENNFSNNTGVSDVEVGLQTTLAVTKEALLSGQSVQSLPKGEAFFYRIAVENSGSFSAANIMAVDDMPAGVSILGVSGRDWVCNNTGSQYSCDFIAALAPGETTYLDFQVVDISANNVTELQNTVTVSAINAPTVVAFNSVQLDNVEFSLTITQNPEPIEANAPFEFVVDIVNSGLSDMLGVQVVNTLPEGFSYGPQTKASTCTVNGQVMTCGANNVIAAGTTESIVVAVQAIAVVDTNVSYTNITTISGANIPNPITVNSTINVGQAGTGAGNFNFTVDMVDDIDPVEINTEFSYIVNMTNTGSNPIRDMNLDVGIPSELTINSFVTNGLDCSTASFGLTCITGTTFNLLPGDSIELVTVKVESTSFIGEVLADTIASIDNILSRRDTQATTIIETIITDADLFVLVSDGGPIDQGDVSEFEVQLKNNGPAIAVSPTLSIVTTGLLDNVAVAQGNDWTCQVNALTVDCQFNSATMSNGHQSTIVLSANSTQVVLEEQDIVVTANVSSITNDPDLTNNVATSIVDVTGTPTEGEIGEAILDAFGGSTGNPQLDSAIGSVSEYCEATFFNGLEGTCDDLYDAALEGDVEAIQAFLEEITPNEVIGQSTSIAEIAGAQFRNVGARLNQVRGGGGRGFSSAGLNARYGNGSIPLGMLAYLDQTEEESKAIDTNNDFISPWGFFVNGTISLGERDATGRELGFDFDTFGLTAGFDYRIDAKKVVGAALGYANFDSKIDNDTAELNSTGITLTGYGSFYITDNLYIDARISLASPEFDQSRNINFTIGDSVVDRVAIGKTDASQYSTSMSAGYSFYKNAWNITPNASFTYTSTTVDGFTESGAGEFNIIYSEQDIESLIWSAGIRLSKAISLKKGVITPQFDFDYNYQNLNDANDIVARFVGSTDQLFIIQTDSPDRTYGSAGLGFVYISTNGKQAYINYRSVLGLEGFSRGTYNIGARFEF